MDISSYVMAMMLAFTRIAAFLFFIPFLRTNMIPAIAKITVAFSIALSVLPEMKDVAISNIPEFVGMLFTQFLIGITLAFVVEIIFTAVRIAGGIMDMDTGFAAVNLIDPTSSQQTTIISNLLVLLYTIIFVAVGGINSLIYGITYSFKFTTVDYFAAQPTFYQMFMDLMLYMFTAAIQIALPVMATLFILNIVILIIGKTAPQLNIFMSMFAVKILVTFIFLYIALPYIGDVFGSLNDMLMEKYMLAIDEIFTKR